MYSSIQMLAVPFRVKPGLVTSFRYPDICVRSSVSSRTPFYCSRRISAFRVFLFQALTTYGNYGTSARGGWRAAMTAPLCLPVAVTLWSGTEAVSQRKKSKHDAQQDSTLETVLLTREASGTSEAARQRLLCFLSQWRMPTTTQ